MGTSARPRHAKKRLSRADTRDPGPPGGAELEARLGGAHAVLQELLAVVGEATCEWRRYSKQSPWVLKVSRSKRTLFYVRPDRGAFNVTVILGERATQAALAGQVSSRLHASIRAARAYVEGRPVGVVVKRLADLAGVLELLAVKLEPRQEARSR